MARQLKALVDELLNDGTLERMGADRSSFGSVNELPILVRLLVLSGAGFIEQVKTNLDRMGKVSTGALSDGISQGEVKGQGGAYELELGYEKGTRAAEYYDYVNKGVKGLNGGQSSPYRFRNLYVGDRMLGAIEEWVRRNAISARNEDQVKRLSKLQKKRQSLSTIRSQAKNETSLAYVIARSIKIKGLDRTGFFDDALDAYYGKEWPKAVARAAGADVRLQIREINRENGNDQR